MCNTRLVRRRHTTSYIFCMSMHRGTVLKLLHQSDRVGVRRTCRLGVQVSYDGTRLRSPQRDQVQHTQIAQISTVRNCISGMRTREYINTSKYEHPAQVGETAARAYLHLSQSTLVDMGFARSLGCTHSVCKASVLAKRPAGKVVNRLLPIRLILKKNKNVKRAGERRAGASACCRCMVKEQRLHKIGTCGM